MNPSSQAAESEGMTDYYSLLRISPRASKLDIINAYRQAKLTFRDGSLAVYSLYSEDELELIRQEIDKAYAVLSDREKRQAYDAEHGFAPAAQPPQSGWTTADIPALAEGSSHEDSDKAEGSVSGVRHTAGANVVRLYRRKQRDYDPDLERRIQSAEVFPGKLLREIREYRGIELQDVADHTRISIQYLRAIENEDTAFLPARAYLKGYLGQYAAEIDLEPHRVVQGYPPLGEEPSSH
jgi:curved DNA-binding protein CbpA